jgi:hypothetical protein
MSAWILTSVPSFKFATKMRERYLEISATDQTRMNTDREAQCRALGGGVSFESNFRNGTLEQLLKAISG